MQKVLIIGLGLIGGSLGLALRQASNNGDRPPFEITGYDRSVERLQKANQMGAIDYASDALTAAVQDAQIVMLATPALAVHQLLREIAPFLHNGTIVTDSASTKAAVTRWAEDLLPADIPFIGGHPMAGATGSLEAARADLFHDATYCLTPGRAATPQAIETLYRIIQALGATPLLIDAATHDRCVAAISHVPFLASVALVEMLTQDTHSDLMSRLASSGFRDTTRLASGDPTMYHDISLTNREAILSWLDAYSEQLQALRQILATADEAGDPRLKRFFEQARQQRQNIIRAKIP
ncbi:MAG TPA: prephenate dehydrogenase/arogenate dehydrogenase family protein [Ktedonobacterales bacterium]|nr:prephenate dehydrogenase/arogenate dehydrogenase family protein [Ktedonobacterales bacterium]